LRSYLLATRAWNTPEGEDVPTQAERSAIERVQSTLKQSKAAIEVELEMKG
jgi:hypothetical protein